MDSGSRRGGQHSQVLDGQMLMVDGWPVFLLRLCQFLDGRWMDSGGRRGGQHSQFFGAPLISLF
jgi:hypothetical protein